MRPVPSGQSGGARHEQELILTKRKISLELSRTIIIIKHTYSLKT